MDILAIHVEPDWTVSRSGSGSSALLTAQPWRTLRVRCREDADRVAKAQESASASILLDVLTMLTKSRGNDDKPGCVIWSLGRVDKRRASGGADLVLRKSWTLLGNRGHV